ncbi:MAG TPA: hypothetical protein VHM00_02645 [Caldimonas sp.]|nr:hypothetical protein [Caldimonas sp.]HEX2539960.1 hypothetical protein [Caldimonas sp.]
MEDRTASAESSNAKTAQLIVETNVIIDSSKSLLSELDVDADSRSAADDEDFPSTEPDVKGV